MKKVQKVGLALRSETVRQLSGDALRNAHGGVGDTGPTANSNWNTCGHSCEGTCANTCTQPIPTIDNPGCTGSGVPQPQ